jgi:hypothetical protein
MRKARIAAERRDVVRSASLADAATSGGATRPGRRRARGVQRVRAGRCEPYATPSYVLMETGVAEMRLKRLDVAVERPESAAIT